MTLRGSPTRLWRQISPSQSPWARHLKVFTACSPIPTHSRRPTPTRLLKAPQQLMPPRQPCRALHLVDAAQRRRNLGRQVQCSPLLKQGKGERSGKERRIPIPHVCRTAVLLSESELTDVPNTAWTQWDATWSVQMRPDARGIHMGDITELGNVVAGAFEQPSTVGDGKFLSLSGDLMSWDEIVATLVSQGHDSGVFPGHRGPLGDSRHVRLFRGTHLLRSRRWGENRQRESGVDQAIYRFRHLGKDKHASVSCISETALVVLDHLQGERDFLECLRNGFLHKSVLQITTGIRSSGSSQCPRSVRSDH